MPFLEPDPHLNPTLNLPPDRIDAVSMGQPPLEAVRRWPPPTPPAKPPPPPPPPDPPPLPPVRALRRFLWLKNRLRVGGVAKAGGAALSSL